MLSGHNHSFRRLLPLLLISSLVAACGGVSIPVGSTSSTHDNGEDALVTGSVSSSPLAENPVLPADRIAISDAIRNLNQEGNARLPMSWHSETSGNQGSILSLTPLAVQPGITCLEFVTTANTFQGIENYNGTACRDDLKNWQVIQLTGQKSAEEADSS